MKTINPFIKLGWHTVPLRGELKRREDGSKTEPTFEKAWREKYKATRNTIQSKLGGALTGELSNIIAIDCDNDVTYQLFKSLDPEYAFEFRSKGKLNADKEEKLCGTLIYEYDGDLPDSFSINDGSLALDVYSNNGFVYLPTSANETKVAWTGRLPEVAKLPAATKVLLQQLKQRHAAPSAGNEVNDNIMTANCLAPLVREFTTTRKFMPGLFKILTPRSFRQEDQYVKHGYLHPENVPEGRGSEYLSKISAILGADISIDEELYSAAMHDLNNLWDSPMDSDRLDATIIDPMVSKRASIDGKVIWEYDENWEQHRLILSTKRQSSVELGFDDRRNMYYCVDTSNQYISVFNKDTDLMAYIGAIARRQLTKPEMKQSIPLIAATADPSRDFGFHSDADPTVRTLNTFMSTPELAILKEPDLYKPMYRKPETILKFLETLIPDDLMRNYLLQFLKRKLTTFEYSPTILYFMGVQGSGKDTFVRILETIMGLGRVAKPTTKEFLEMYNGWMLDTYFAQLDEYGNQLTSLKDREEALGKLKAYTGKQTIQVRQMRTDGFDYKHNITFVMTANKNPLMLEDGDRRIAFLPTPNVLLDAEWVQEQFVESSALHAKLDEEVKDFCYYLATEVEMPTSNSYMKPPESPHKRILIADSMYAAQRLAYVLKHNMMDYIENLCHDYGAPGLLRAINNGRIHTEDLEELYDLMTDYKGEMRSLNKAIRGVGIELKATTRNGSKTYYYNLDCFNGTTFEAEDESE